MKQAIQQRIHSRDKKIDSIIYAARYNVIAGAFTLPYEAILDIKNTRDEKRIEKINELEKLYQEEYVEQKEEAEKINETITELKSSIQDKMSFSSQKPLSLEQLRKYKDLLEGANELLSQQDEISSNNKRQK